MKKISIYVNEVTEGAVDKIINILGDIIWDNNMELVNIKQEKIPALSIEGLEFESDEKGYVIK